MTKQKRTTQKFLVLVAIASLVLTGLGATPAFSAAWSSTNVSNNPSRSVNSSIAVDRSGVIHVVWEEEDTEIYYKKSSNGGASWSTAVDISRSPSSSTPSKLPRIAVAPNGSLHVVWVEFTGNWEIYYSQFKNGEWSTPRNISNTFLYLSDSPQIVVDSAGKIHVVWQDNNEIAYSSSADGLSWPNSPEILPTDQTGSSYEPSLSAAGNTLHLVWQQRYMPQAPGLNPYYNIRYRTYNIAAGTWDSQQLIAGGLTLYRGNPEIAPDTTGKPHVVWVEGSNTEIYYSRLEGTTWMAPFNISNTTTLSGRPAIAADGFGNLHAVWDEMDVDYDIYYSRFNGGSWSYRENVLNNDSQSEAPSIAGDGSANPNIVWQDSGSGNGDIFFARATGPITIFSTGFENAPGMSNSASGWEIGADPYPGQPSAVAIYWSERLESDTWDTAHFGSRGAWAGDSNTKKYVPYMNSYARTTFDLTQFKDATLTFWYRFNAPNETTDQDYGVLNIILNGDPIHPIRQIFYQDMAPKPWTQETVDLTSYGGRSIVGNKVTLEWRWVSGGDATVGEGMYIDDILVTGNAQDQVAPAAVGNLSVAGTTDTSVTLSWNAPGDDGNTGTATQYDVRYSTSPINWNNWASATTTTGEPVPKTAGSAETFTVPGLSAGTTYYFALETADEAGNWSYLSNVPSAQAVSNATVNLVAGWNLVSLPVRPINSLKAQDVIDNIKANGGVATKISKWDPVTWRWVTHSDGGPNNFDIVLGEGYFIRVTTAGNWTVVGNYLTSSISLNLKNGWNLVGVPYSSTSYTAQGLIDAIKAQGGNATKVSKWDTVTWRWVTHSDGGPNNFNIIPGEGYFIRCTLDSTFVP